MFRGFPKLFALALVLLPGSAAVAAEQPTAACDLKGDLKSDEWRTACDAAIAGEADTSARAVLLFARAYSSVELYRYDDALADLGLAIAANPDKPSYLHERAYVFGELSDYKSALADLDREIQLLPSQTAYRERAYARHYSGDFEGAFADRARALELEPESPDALLARGRAALWLGKFDAATADAKRAAKIAAATQNEESAKDAEYVIGMIAHWKAVSAGKKSARLCTEAAPMQPTKSTTLIGDCTQAFFEAGKNAARADALTSRSLAWRVRAGDSSNATEDLRIALALDPANFHRPLNLGFAFLSSGHSWAANREFERAIGMERHWLSLAGRARARANLGNLAGAEEDARASLELHPNEVATRLLADLAFDAGDKDRAREMYLAVYKLGSRTDDLLARLAELGVEDPEHAAAK